LAAFTSPLPDELDLAILVALYPAVDVQIHLA
jgi:hypothetical protein